MVTKWQEQKITETTQLKSDFRDAFRDMEKKKVAAQVESLPLKELKNTKKIKEQETILAANEDGTPLIDGKNQTIKDAQIQDHIKDINIQLQKQERQAANADFELGLTLDRISLLRNLSRLLRSEVQIICDMGEEEFEERD